jgi:hypothetical protein
MGETPDDGLQQVKGAIDGYVVPAIFDDTARIRHGGAVAIERPPDIAEAQPVGDMRKIHGDLPRESRVRAAAGRLAQVACLDLEGDCDREFDDVLEVSGGTAVPGAAPKRITARIGNTEPHIIFPICISLF